MRYSYGDYIQENDELEKMMENFAKLPEGLEKLNSQMIKKES